MSTVNMPTVMALQVDGALTAGAGKVTVAAPFDGKIGHITAAVGTAPTGADLVLDVNVAGTSVFAVDPTDHVSVAATEQSGDAAPTAAADVIDFVRGDLITIDIDQIGSTVAGSDLTVCIEMDADLNPTD